MRLSDSLVLSDIRCVELDIIFEDILILFKWLQLKENIDFIKAFDEFFATKHRVASFSFRPRISI